MICRNCGRSIPDVALYCVHCHAPVEIGDETRKLNGPGAEPRDHVSVGPDYFDPNFAPEDGSRPDDGFAETQSDLYGSGAQPGRYGDFNNYDPNYGYDNQASGGYGGYPEGGESPKERVGPSKKTVWLASGGAALAVGLLILLFVLLQPKGNTVVPSPDPDELLNSAPPSGEDDGFVTPPEVSLVPDVSASPEVMETPPVSPSDGGAVTREPISPSPISVYPLSTANEMMMCAPLLGESFDVGVPPAKALLSDFLQRAIAGIQPTKRFAANDGGYFIPAAEMETILRESLGLSGLSTSAYTNGTTLYAKDDGVIWKPSGTAGQSYDFFQKTALSSGGQQVFYNVFTERSGYSELLAQYVAETQTNANAQYFASRLISLMEIGDFPRVIAADASSALADRDGYSYLPDTLIDGRAFTGWSSDSGDGGGGQSLTLTLETSASISGMSILNGDGKDGASYIRSGRAKEIRVDFGGGKTKTFTLADAGYSAAGLWQALRFGESISTDTITITILSTYAGDTYPEVVLSELYVF